MSNNFWSYSPELKTTGVVKKFTQKLEYKKCLNSQKLEDFLNAFKILSQTEIT